MFPARFYEKLTLTLALTPGDDRRVIHDHDSARSLRDRRVSEHARRGIVRREQAMISRNVLKNATLIAAGAGVALHAYTAVSENNGIDAFVVVLFLWSCLPYVVWTLLATAWSSPRAAAGAAFATLVADFAMHWNVFGSAAHSTVALGLLVMPFVSLACAGPIGMLIAVLILKNGAPAGEGAKT